MVTRAGERETPGQFWRVGIYVNYLNKTGDYIPLFYCAYVTLPFVQSLVIIIYNRLPPRFQYVLSALTVFLRIPTLRIRSSINQHATTDPFFLRHFFALEYLFLIKTSHTLACSKGFLPRQGIVTSSAKLV